jgi:hypothetical protein
MSTRKISLAYTMAFALLFSASASFSQQERKLISSGLYQTTLNGSPTGEQESWQVFEQGNQRTYEIELTSATLFQSNKQIQSLVADSQGVPMEYQTRVLTNKSELEQWFEFLPTQVITHRIRNHGKEEIIKTDVPKGYAVYRGDAYTILSTLSQYDRTRGGWQTIPTFHFGATMKVLSLELCRSGREQVLLPNGTAAMTEHYMFRVPEWDEKNNISHFYVSADGKIVLFRMLYHEYDWLFYDINYNAQKKDWTILALLNGQYLGKEEWKRQINADQTITAYSKWPPQAGSQDFSRTEWRYDQGYNTLAYSEYFYTSDKTETVTVTFQTDRAVIHSRDSEGHYKEITNIIPEKACYNFTTGLFSHFIMQKSALTKNSPQKLYRINSDGVQDSSITMQVIGAENIEIAGKKRQAYKIQFKYLGISEWTTWHDKNRLLLRYESNRPSEGHRVIELVRLEGDPF